MNSQVSNTITPAPGKKEGNTTLLNSFKTGTGFALTISTTKGEGDSTKVEKKDTNKKTEDNDPLKPKQVLFDYTVSPEEDKEKGTKLDKSLEKILDKNLDNSSKNNPDNDLDNSKSKKINPKKSEEKVEKKLEEKKLEEEKEEVKEDETENKIFGNFQKTAENLF